MLRTSRPHHQPLQGRLVRRDDGLLNYEHSAWCDAFGEAKYVFGHRNNSDRAIESAIRSTVAKYGSAAAVATVANFKSGALYDVSPIGNWGDDQYWSLQSLISRTLQTRCWKLTHA